jgi:hypothetical protein
MASRSQEQAPLSPLLYCLHPLGLYFFFPFGLHYMIHESLPFTFSSTAGESPIISAACADDDDVITTFSLLSLITHHPLSTKTLTLGMHAVGGNVN